MRRGVRVTGLQMSGSVRFVVGGATGGNVHLRTALYQAVSDDARSLALSKAIVAAKLQNSRNVVDRWGRFGRVCRSFRRKSVRNRAKWPKMHRHQGPYVRKRSMFRLSLAFLQNLAVSPGLMPRPSLLRRTSLVVKMNLDLRYDPPSRRPTGRRTLKAPVPHQRFVARPSALRMEWRSSSDSRGGRAHRADRGRLVSTVLEPCCFPRRLQDIESDTGYDTWRRVPDGVLARVSQTAVYDTC